MPSEKDLDNPEIGPYVEKYLKSAVSARKRMRLAKFIQNWVAGLHGVGTWQGAGSAEAQMLTLHRIFDFESRKTMAKELAGL
jgi:4-hydroxybutyryl-CoA dehydratase/vinylacetyl-CoA-Delta-isomerase